MTPLITTPCITPLLFRPVFGLGNLLSSRKKGWKVALLVERYFEFESNEEKSLGKKLKFCYSCLSKIDEAAFSSDTHQRNRELFRFL